MKPRRELFLPGPEAPHWLPAGDAPGGLLYLAWGTRRYGDNPIPQRVHHGWTYMAVLSGRPVLLVGSRRESIQPGGLVIAGPDVPYGWTDSPSASCKILVWVWSRSPAFQVPVHGNSCWLRKCPPSALADIERLHLSTRREIQQVDSHSSRVLDAMQTLVDASFERSSGFLCNQSSLRSAQRLHLAEAWMRRHLDMRAPVRALADYLGVSSMTLQRLFRDAGGVSTGQAFLEIKMKEASKLIKAGNSSVKGIALSLGYKHPGDFTRAFTKFFGFPPSESP